MLILSEARAEQSPVPTERTPKAPLPAQLTERLYQICNCRLPPAAPSFPSCRKRRGRKGALGDAGCFLPLNLGGNQCFHLALHSILTSRAFWYAPPDTGEPDLQLVALERLLSIEGALEIQMNFTFLRGPCRSRAPPLQRITQNFAAKRCSLTNSCFA